MKKIAKLSLSVVLASAFVSVVLCFYAGVSHAFGFIPFLSTKPNFVKAQEIYGAKFNSVQNNCINNFSQIIDYEYCVNASQMPNFSNCFVHNAQTTNTTQQNNIYAKARENCVLFLTADITNTTLDNQLFIVPTGYFVRLIDTNNDDCYQVAYGDKIGFCVPTSLKRVSFTPTIATLDSQQLVTKSDGSGTILRQTASASSEQVVLIPAGSNIEYVASLSGDKPADGLSREWYYVRYYPPQEPTIYYEGYVYSERAVNPPVITPNLEDEKVSDISNTLLPDDNQSPAYFPNWLKGLVIALLCLPALLFGIYLLVAYKRRKQTENVL